MSYGALTWKPSQGTNLYCLVNRGTLVWTTCPRSLPDKAAAGNWTHDLPIASPRLHHYTTEPPVPELLFSFLKWYPHRHWEAGTNHVEVQSGRYRVVNYPQVNRTSAVAICHAIAVIKYVESFVTVRQSTRCCWSVKDHFFIIFWKFSGVDSFLSLTEWDFSATIRVS